MISEQDTPDSPRAREETDIHPGLIVRVALMAVVGIAVALVALALLFHLFHRSYPDRTSEASPVVVAADLPPAPRLQSEPARDLEEVRKAEALHLSRYAWVNREQGIAQIPIERAMSLWVQTQGATAAVAAASTSSAATELQMRQDKAKEAHAP